MISRRVRHTLGRLAGVGLVAAVAVGMAATPAFADTSTATANAATLLLGTSPLLTTGSCTSSNAGPPAATQTCGQTPNLSLLGTQTAIQAGLLVQQTVARNDGTSAACAGLVGPGGTIQIGTGGTCTPTTGPGGVVLNLGGIAVVKADAILAECNATAGAAATVPTVQLVNATISLLGGTPTPINSSPTPNTTLLNLGLVTIKLNVQPATVPAPPAGSVSTTALDLQVLPGIGSSLVHLTVGTVSCGPNAVTPNTPVIPLEGAPIAVAIVVVAGYIGYRFWWLPRNRAESLV